MPRKTKRSVLLAAVAAGLLAAGGGAAGNLIHAQEAKAPAPSTSVEAQRAQQAQAREALKKDLADDLKQLDAFSRAFRAVAKLVNPSVVHIRVTKEITGEADAAAGAPDDELLRRFFGLTPQGGEDDAAPRSRRRAVPRATQEAEGSGVVYSADGLILTNNHVVADEDKIVVDTADGRALPAKVVGTDPKSDLAVVRVDAKDLIPIELGDSSELDVGDWVIAIGNPFGLQHTVTAGIVSAVGRSGVGITDYEDFIQTDAAINPGNSGGALVDLHGRLVGINTAIASRSGGFQGVGFAIPVNMVKKNAEQLIAHGHVRRGWLGISIQALSPELARRFGIADGRGVLVGGVLPSGPAAEAGVKSGDVVVTVAGAAVDSSTTLRNRIATFTPGTDVKLGIVRDGKPLEVGVKLGELEDQTAQALTRERGAEAPSDAGAPQAGAKLGFSVRAITPAIARQLKLSGAARGVVVDAVDPGSPAAEAGLERGDVIDEVNRAPTEDLDAFDAAMKAGKPSEGILLRVRRGELESYVVVKTEVEQSR